MGVGVEPSEVSCLCFTSCVISILPSNIILFTTISLLRFSSIVPTEKNATRRQQHQQWFPISLTLSVCTLTFDLPCLYLYFLTHCPFSWSPSLTAEVPSAMETLQHGGQRQCHHETVGDSMGCELFQRATIFRIIYFVCHLILLFFHPAWIPGLRRQWWQEIHEILNDATSPNRW